jgi:hypothetical protein
MPRNAIKHVEADYIVRLEEISAIIAKLATTDRVAGTWEDDRHQKDRSKGAVDELDGDQNQPNDECSSKNLSGVGVRRQTVLSWLLLCGTAIVFPGCFESRTPCGLQSGER